MSSEFFYFILSLLICSKLSSVWAQQNEEDIMKILTEMGIDPLKLTSFLQGNNLNIKDICANIKNSSKEDLCTNQLKIICDNDWFILRMLDATSKFPFTGMLVKSNLDLGSFDECIDLDLTTNGTRVMGKHCTGGLVVPLVYTNTIGNISQVTYFLSVCIPDGCSGKDMQNFFNVSSDWQVIFNDAMCSTKDTGKDLGLDDYCTIALFLIVIIAMTVATVCDLYLKQEHILVKAFSVYHNGKKLFQASKITSDQIGIIHGLRVISMMWIIAAHTFATMPSFPGIHTNFSLTFEISRSSAFITSAHLAVDTFFFISGFLLAYQYLKEKSVPLKSHVKRIPYLYLYRYFRITPVLAVAFLVNVTIFKHIGNGPIFSYVKIEADKCLNHWWSFFLYVQNYVNSYDEMCMLGTWYLSADWQLFLISPIILIPVAIFAKRYFKWIIAQLILLIVFFTLAPVGLKFLLKDFNNLFETHAYLNDYFIGVLMGVFIRVKNSSIKYRINYKANIILWIIALLTMFLSVTGYKEIQRLVYFHNDLSYYSYLILIRAFWSISLSWIIYSCYNGHGGLANVLLTTPFVQLLSKLSYCMYIVHMGPVMYFRFISRVLVVYSLGTVIADSIFIYVVTFIISIFATLAFESPIITLEKHLFAEKR